MFTSRGSFICVFLNLIFTKTTAATTIATYTEAGCQGSFRVIEGPNGVNGTCSELGSKGDYKSFKVLDKDLGCAVTVYQYREERDAFCSSAVLELVPPTNPCYNNTWFYYSIDNCEQEPLSATPNAADTLASTASPTQSTSIPVTDRSPPPTATGDPLPSSDQSNNDISRPDYYSPNKPIIVGSIVGSFVGLTLLSMLLFWIHARRRARSSSMFPQSEKFPPSEMEGSPPREMGSSPSLKDKVITTSELPNATRYEMCADNFKSLPSSSSGTRNITEPIGEVIDLYAGLAANPYSRTAGAPYASTIYTEIAVDDASTHAGNTPNPMQRTSSRSSRTTRGSVYSERSLPPLPAPLRPRSIVPNMDVRQYPVARAKGSNMSLIMP